MNTYTIAKKPDNFSWDQIPVLTLNVLDWSPKTDITAQGQICYDDKALYVRLQAVEANIRAEEVNPLGAPCEDSCLEFFFCPIPGDERYFNIEFSPNLCMYLGMGSSIENSIRMLPRHNIFSPNAFRTEDGWVLEFSVPYTFIRQYFPEFSPVSGNTIRANCYKCGDSTVQEHFLAWNPVPRIRPSAYHNPKAFGEMRFE